MDSRERERKLNRGRTTREREIEELARYIENIYFRYRITAIE